MMTSADQRLLAANALDAILDSNPLDPSAVLAGSPEASLKALDQIDGVEFGIWQLTPGTARDIEADEVFLVLTGDATVEFEDGSQIELRPGVIVRLHAGDHTTWVVRETLRKAYLA